MVVSRHRLGLTAALVFAAGAAQAADYSPPPPQCYDVAIIASGRAPPGAVPCYVPPPVIEEFSGWYLRGDIGFSNQSVGSLASDNYIGYASVTNTNKSFDSAPFFGIGIGYYFNDWLRFDVTGEYRGKANFHGLDIGAFPAGSPYGTGFAPDRYSGSKSELTFLLNGYIDLGTWYSVTPFIGAGVGFSRNTISDFGDVGIACKGSMAPCAADTNFATASKWNFAWALHAGLAYKVSKNFTVELAYRYIDLGNAVTGIGFAYDASQTFATFEFRHLTSHDVKLGLRFNLDGFSDCCSRSTTYYAPQPTYVAPPVYAPPPIYAPQPTYQPPLRSRG